MLLCSNFRVIPRLHRKWKGVEESAEPAGKPGSVVDSHSSRPPIAGRLKQPTRNQRGPRQWFPIWSCSRWGLPCRPVTRLAVRSYRTISPLPAEAGGIFLLHFPSTRAAQALPGIVPCGARTFLVSANADATAWPTPPAYSTASPANTPQSLLRKRLGPKAQAVTPPIRACGTNRPLTQGAAEIATFLLKRLYFSAV